MSTPEQHAVKHFLQFSDLSADDYAYLFERAALIKKHYQALDRLPDELNKMLEELENH